MPDLFSAAATTATLTALAHAFAPFERPPLLFAIPIIILAAALFCSRRISRNFAARLHAARQTDRAEIRRLTDELHQRSATTIKPMANHADHLAELTDRHQQRSRLVTTAAAEAAENAATIATAAVAMNAAIGEIEHQADNATSIARRAVAKAQLADASVTRLTDRAEQITSIAALIRTIAERTNLLALNAAIEAARASQHRHGFAIVAHEVKALAKQTAAATADIETKLGDAREVSLNARAEMEAVQEVVEQITGAALAIKTALAQQHAATRDISFGAERTTAATRAVTDGIGHALVTTEEIRGICEKLNAQLQEATH